jgi:putative aldouronate transport system substrate-binding protein
MPFVHGALSAWAYVFAPAYGYFTLDSSPLELVYKKTDPRCILVPWEQTPAFKSASAFMNSLYKAGYVAKDTLVSSAQNDVTTVLRDGRAASAIHIFDIAANLSSQVKAAHPDWIFKPYNFYDIEAPNVVAVNQAVCLNANGKNPERTLMFLNWVAKSQANYDLLLYGIPDKTYRLVDGAVDPIKDSAGRAVYTDWMGNWAFQDFDFHRYTVDYPKGYRAAYLAAATYKAVDTPTAGFVLNTDPIRTEYAKRLSIYREMAMAIGQGVLGPDKYDEYIDRQKEAGLDKLLSEAQRQLDEWKAAQK